MEKQRVTMKDIAQRVGVSLSTVSYVLNYSNKEKISHDTRIKIFAAAKEMGYVPNLSARSLASKKSNLVGIIVNYNKATTKSKRYSYYDLVEQLQYYLSKKGYDTIFASTDQLTHDLDVIFKHSFEATFIIDIDNENFYKVTNHFYTPLILIDSLIADDLFYRIIPDYDYAINKAKVMLQSISPYLLIDSTTNLNLLNYITRHFDIKKILINDNTKDLEELVSKAKGQKTVVIGELLTSKAEQYLNHKDLAAILFSEPTYFIDRDIKQINLSYKRLAKEAVSLFEDSLRMDYTNFPNKTIIVR